MKQLDPALQAHLDEGTTTLAWCWRITRADGVVFGFTDHDRPLVFDGTTFEPGTGFTASELRASADLAVDAQDAEGVLSSDRISETEILEGRWDNAQVEVFRVNWQDPAQRALLRRGAIGELRRGRVAFVAEVRSLAHQLGQTVGRVFQGSCDARLGDGRCGVDPQSATVRAEGSVAELRRARSFVAAGIGGYASGWFTLGRLEWTSGANAGRVDEVREHRIEASVAVLILLEPPVRPLEPGDTFVVRAGCDKTLDTCATRFANVANFRGFPHIPGQDEIVRNARVAARSGFSRVR